MTQPPEIVGLAEIAVMFDVPKSTASSWTRQHSFPAPVHRLAAGTFWNKTDVQEWKRPTVVLAPITCAACGGQATELFPHAKDDQPPFTCAGCGATVYPKFMVDPRTGYLAMATEAAQQ